MLARARDRRQGVGDGWDTTEHDIVKRTVAVLGDDART